MPMSELLEPTRTGTLRDVHESSKLVPYMCDVWKRRGYVRYVATSELKRRQVDNVLGNVWHLLNPALQIGVYYIIFGQLLDVGDRSSQNFILFLTVGLFIFQFTQRATVDGAKSIVTNLGLIKAIKFPRAILPLTSTATEASAFWSSLVVIYFVALVSEGARWQWIVLPVLVVVQTFFNMGSAMVAARMTTYFRDTIQILPFFFRLLLYGSGVIFSVDAYAEDNSTISWLFTANPMYCFVTVARWTVFGGELQLRYVLSLSAWTVVLFVFGFLWFRAGEEQYARG